MLKSRGVLPRLWNDWAKHRQIQFGPGKDDPGPIELQTDIEWLGEEFRDQQVTFRTDLVTDIGNDQILHVEQQTKHNELVMLRRMATYASLISSFYKYKKNLLQLYYYTGDPIARWQAVEENKATILNYNWSSANRFVFIDAGAHDAWAMLKSGHLEYAMLGLLSREVPNLEQFVEGLLALLARKHEPGTLDSLDRLVTCIMVASLRGREDFVMEKANVRDRGRLHREQHRFYTRLKPLIGEMVDAHIETEVAARVKAQVDAHHGNLQNLMDRFVRLEEVAGVRFPAYFLSWSTRHLSPDQLEQLERRISDHPNMHALLDACGIPRESLGTTVNVATYR